MNLERNVSLKQKAPDQNEIRQTLANNIEENLEYIYKTRSQKLANFSVP